jgi:hypothetical protein
MVKIALLLIILLIVLPVEVFVNLATANPAPGISMEWISPPSGTKTPSISIFAPNNNTVYASNNISLTFNVSIAEMWNNLCHPSEVFNLMEVNYTADWQKNSTSVFPGTDKDRNWYLGTYEGTFPYNKTFSLIDGKHTINITAKVMGRYQNESTLYWFYIFGSSSVSFTVDTSPPNISLLSIKNQTYFTSDIPLDFALSKPVSWMVYCLDDGVNITLNGNGTIAGLSYGVHCIKVYANDTAGTLGTKTVYFNVEPFPTTLIITASGVSITGVVVCLLYYHKRRNH